MKEIKIKFDIELREWQKEVINTNKKYSVLVIHRRAGKTFISVVRLIKEAFTKTGYYGYIGPYYKQTKAIAWDMLKKLIKQIPNVDINESELRITLPNNSVIRLFGADNPDSLRGLDLRGVVFDEYAQQPINIYSEIIFPMLNANNGWVQFIGTPKGKNSFYTLYERGLRNNNYYVRLLGVSNTKLLNEEQLKEAKSEMTNEEYEQEYECSFTASIKGAYYKNELELMRKQGRIKAGLYDPLLPVYTFWDLGISDYMAILFVQIYGNVVRIIDSVSENGKGFEYYNRVLKEKNYIYEKHYFPHDIEVRELSTGQSRLEIVMRLFGESRCYVLPKMQIIDGINAVRRIFHNIYIDESLDEFINAISLYKQKYDEKRDLFLDTPEHDWTSHYADSLRYMGIGYNLLTEKTAPQKIIVSQRYF